MLFLEKLLKVKKFNENDIELKYDEEVRELANEFKEILMDRL